MKTPVFIVLVMVAVAQLITARPTTIRPNRRPFPFGSMFAQPGSVGAVPPGPPGPVTDKPFGGLFELLNNGQLGNATATGAGAGSVIDHIATGQGIGTAQAGQGGFAIGLGVGGAIDTPLGPLAFGGGEGQAVGK